MKPLGTLALHMAMLSLLAFGSVSSVLPDMHRFLVEQQGWLSDQQFAALYALSQAAPGPNMLYVALFGLQIAGFTGALVCTVAMLAPSSLLALGFERYAGHHSERAWHRRLRAALGPLSIGLVLSTGWILAGTANRGSALALTAVAAALHWRTRLNPVWLMAGGAVLGMSGLV